MTNEKTNRDALNTVLALICSGDIALDPDTFAVEASRYLEQFETPESESDDTVTVPGIDNQVGDWTGEFATACHYMDDELRETMDINHDTPAQFVVDDYAALHLAVFGEQWVIN